MAGLDGMGLKPGTGALRVDGSIQIGTVEHHVLGRLACENATLVDRAEVALAQTGVALGVLGLRDQRSDLVGSLCSLDGLTVAGADE